MKPFNSTVAKSCIPEDVPKSCIPEDVPCIPEDVPGTFLGTFLAS